MKKVLLITFGILWIILAAVLVSYYAIPTFQALIISYIIYIGGFFAMITLGFIAYFFVHMYYREVGDDTRYDAKVGEEKVYSEKYTGIYSPLEQVEFTSIAPKGPEYKPLPKEPAPQKPFEAELKEIFAPDEVLPKKEKIVKVVEPKPVIEKKIVVEKKKEKIVEPKPIPEPVIEPVISKTVSHVVEEEIVKETVVEPVTQVEEPEPLPQVEQESIPPVLPIAEEVEPEPKVEETPKEVEEPVEPEQPEIDVMVESNNADLIDLQSKSTVPFVLWSDFSLNISQGWDVYFKNEARKQYWKDMMTFLINEYKTGKIYPPKEDLFRCFELTDFANVKVVILGKIPFYRKDQADGLAFSTRKGLVPNQTTSIVIKEAVDDVGISTPKDGNLDNWAKQGVLLMNSTMTAPSDKPASHTSCGWTTFTDTIIELLNTDRRPKVFVFWGEHAQALKASITNPNHLIITAPNPSPLSAANGFYGSKPFSQINEYLIKNGYTPIDWTL